MLNKRLIKLIPQIGARTAIVVFLMWLALLLGITATLLTCGFISRFAENELNMRFNDTIGNNIRIAKPDASDDEIIEAAKKASMHEFISNLPSGYNTTIGELGERLSGGEKQRIGLARAFLSGANIMLLDEPTSNLDSLNEAIILKSLHGAKDKTVVLVSHRKSTLGIADKTYHMPSIRKS